MKLVNIKTIYNSMNMNKCVGRWEISCDDGIIYFIDEL